MAILSRNHPVLFALAVTLLAPAARARGSEPAGERCGRARAVTEVQAPAAAALCNASRPGTTPNAIASAHFVVHYPAAGTAAYAQDVSDAAERGYRTLIDTLGYAIPPDDGDGRTDIYVLTVGEMGGAWGTTYCEGPQTGGIYPNGFRAWVTVVDTLSLNRLQTVTVHEYFHVIQIGYDADENASFLEMLSTWAEERIYDDNNTYYEVLPGFFDQPEKALWGHVYSNVVWALFLSENYGDDLIRDILHECGLVAGSDNTLLVGAHDTALGALAGSSFLDELTRFTLWNYHTGARDDGMHYREGAAWPEIAVEKRSRCYPFPTYMTTHIMGTYGSNYFFFDGNGATDSLRLAVQPEWQGNSTLTLTRYAGASRATDRYDFVAFTLEDTIVVGDWAGTDSLLAIMHARRNNSDVWFSASFKAAPRPAQAWILVLDRDSCRRPFDGSGDEFSDRDGQERAWSDELSALGIPYAQSDSIPDDLTLCGGVIVTGGWNGAGPNLSDGELVRLMSYMDGGGNVYLESRRFGEWGDPGQTGGTPNEELFFSYFGASFVPGNDMATGNVTSWSSSAVPLGAQTFDYDAFDPPDDLVGSLVPTTADTLAVDALGDVRMTLSDGPMGAKLVCATVLLGASTGTNGSTREQFVSSVIDLFGTIVPVLSVVQMNVSLSGSVVTFDGELGGYGGEPLALRRYDGGGVSTIDWEATPGGAGWRFRARDEAAPAGEVTYRLYLTTQAGAEQRLLWSQSLDTRSGVRPLALAAVYPNPARSDVRVLIQSDSARDVTLSIYDVAGRRLHAESRRVAAGDNTLRLGSAALQALPSGIYFVRVEKRGFRAQRKLVILR